MKEIQKRLNKSIKEKFYFEALFILASLIENSIKKIIETKKKERLSFEIAIDKANKEKLISDNLSQLLHNWREERNLFVHNLISKDIDEDSLENIVTDGVNILKNIEEELIWIEKQKKVKILNI